MIILFKFFGRRVMVRIRVIGMVAIGVYILEIIIIEKIIISIIIS
jgi:uncharacterized membrane protein YiaA